MPDSDDFYDLSVLFDSINNPARLAYDLSDVRIVKLGHNPPGLRKSSKMLDHVEYTTDKAAGNFGAGFGNVGSEFFKVETSRRSPNQFVSHSANSSLTFS